MDWKDERRLPLPERTAAEHYEAARLLYADGLKDAARREVAKGLVKSVRDLRVLLEKGGRR